MKRTLLAAFAIASVPAAAAERRYTVTDFDRVLLEGPYEVVLATGKAGSAVARGSTAALDRLEVKVLGRMLRIRPSRSAWGGYPGEDSGTLRIELSTHELRGLSVNGSGSISADKARAGRFDAAVGGSGRIGIADVDADTLALSLSGSGALDVAGRAKLLRATVSGGGDLQAEGLTAEDAEIKADTSGRITLGVKRTAKIHSTGAGDVEIAGTPACTVEAKGVGRVKCGAPR